MSELAERFFVMLRDRCEFPASEAKEHAKSFEPYLEAPYEEGKIHATFLFSYVLRHEVVGVPVDTESFREHMRGRLALTLGQVSKPGGTPVQIGETIYPAAYAPEDKTPHLP